MAHRTLLLAFAAVLACAPAGLISASAPIPIQYRVVQPKTSFSAVVAVPRAGFPIESMSFSYGPTRNYGIGDFNGDGFQDIVAAPWSIQPPVDYFPVEIWLNNGDQSFRKATGEVIEGPLPHTLQAMEVFVRDFNEDGRPDVMVSDSGIEYPLVEQDSGAPITLLLSQPNGKLVDATANIVPNPKAFNHGEGVGDFNGDGHLDVAINRFSLLLKNQQGIPQKEGVALLLGDGHGNFAEFTAGLPHEIRYMYFADRVSTDYQVSGCTTLAKLDTDNRDDLVTGSYAYDRNPGKTRTIRFFKSMPDDTAVELDRVDIPAEIANIGLGADTIAQDPNGLGLGCPQLIAGDINGDGLDDVVAAWEGLSKTYFQVIRNDGNFQFTDITQAAVGYFSSTFWTDGNSKTYASRIRLIDLNGDGVLDLAFLMGGTPQALLQHAALLNDGSGHFTPLVPQGASGPILPEQILSFCPGCGHSLLFLPTRPGNLPSWVFKELQTEVDAGPPIQTKTIFLTVLPPVLPSVSLSDVSISEGDSGTKQANFAASLSQVYGGPVSFDIYTDAGTAAPGVDYASNAAVGLTIPAGQTSANFPVTINGDVKVEDNETLTVNLANVAGATVARGQARGRIVNDDLAEVSIADATLAEGNTGLSTASFRIFLSHPLPNPVMFDVTTSNGSATAGSDYQARAVQGKYLDAGRSSQVFEVAINGDATVEANESFTVTISNVIGATLGDGSAVGTISNDDGSAKAAPDIRVRRAGRVAPAKKPAIVSP